MACSGGCCVAHCDVIVNNTTPEPVPIYVLHGTDARIVISDNASTITQYPRGQRRREL